MTILKAIRCARLAKELLWCAFALLLSLGAWQLRGLPGQVSAGLRAVEVDHAEARAAIAVAAPRVTAAIAGDSGRVTALLAAVQADHAALVRAAPKIAAAIAGDNQRVAVLLDQAAATADAVNRPCSAKDARGGPLPCGTLADVNRTLATFRGTSGQLEVAANHEDKNLSALDAQESTLFADIHSTMGNVQQMAASGAGILEDGRIEADKIAKPPVKKLTFWGALDAAAAWIHGHLTPPIF